MSELPIGLPGVLAHIGFSKARTRIKEDLDTYADRRLKLAKREAGNGFLLVIEQGQVNLAFERRSREPEALQEKAKAAIIQQFKQAYPSIDSLVVYGIVTFHKADNSRHLNYDKVVSITVYHSNVSLPLKPGSVFQTPIAPLVPTCWQDVVGFIETCARHNAPVVFIYTDTYDGVWVSGSSLTGITSCEITKIRDNGKEIVMYAKVEIEGVTIKDVELAVDKGDKEAWQIYLDVVSTNSGALLDKYRDARFDMVFRSIGYHNDAPRWINSPYLKGVTTATTQNHKGYVLFSELGWE